VSGSLDVSSQSRDLVSTPGMPQRAPRDTTLLALGLIALFGAIYVIVAYFALDRFPYSGDEYSLSLQADLFAKGLLKAATPPHLEWLRLDHVVIDSFIRSKYPPGASALLAIGARHGCAWLVTPIEGTFTIALVWHSVRRILGARPALVALVALGLAPLFVIDAASFYPHAPALAFLAIAFAGVTAWTISRRTWHLVLVGAAIGAAFLVRPTDALFFGIAMLVFRSPRAVIVPALAAIPFVAANLWYQAQQFGSPFADGYHAFEPTYIAIYGAAAAKHALSWRHLFSATQWWNHVDIFGEFCLQWTIPGTVIAALFGAVAVDNTEPSARMRRFSIALVAVYCITLAIMVSDPDDGPHTRYLSPVLIPLALLAANGFAPLCEAIRGKLGPLVQRVLVVLAVLFGLAQLGSYLQDRIPKQWKREGLYQVTHDLAPGSIVIVRAQYPTRFARNGPFFDGVLYLSAPPETSVDEVAAAYPGRPLYVAHEGIPWTLERAR
jgi:4-amino-4-deoxy-L-arabinose transferase-like glycosyltransferase